MEAVELIDRLEGVYLHYGYWLVFLSSFVEISPLGWAIPGGLILAGAGFYAYGGQVGLFPILVFSWLGAWLTFLLAYFLGRKTGLALVKKLRQEENAKKARFLLKKHGGTILTTSMLANLTRFWIAYVAGLQNYSLLKFFFYSAAASLTWTSLMVVVGYLAGRERALLETGLASLGVLAWVLILAALATIYFKTKKEFKKFKGEKENS